MSGAVIGVDGCRAGWVAVTLDADGGWSCALHPSLVSLWSASEGVSRIWLDMPIGLTDGLPTDNGQRGVESACRAVLELIETLTSRDRVEVIAFDTEFECVGKKPRLRQAQRTHERVVTLPI